MYWLAQFLGAFVAAGVVYGNYVNLIDQYESGARTVAPSSTATAGIFATYPAPALTKASQFFDQFIGSAILVFIIFALKDDSNKGKFVASGAWFPLCLFFTLVSNHDIDRLIKADFIARLVLPSASVLKLASLSTPLVTSVHVS